MPSVVKTGHEVYTFWSSKLRPAAPYICLLPAQAITPEAKQTRFFWGRSSSVVRKHERPKADFERSNAMLRRGPSKETCATGATLRSESAWRTFYVRYA